MVLALDLILISLNIIGVTHQSAKSELLEVRKKGLVDDNGYPKVSFIEGSAGTGW